MAGSHRAAERYSSAPRSENCGNFIMQEELRDLAAPPGNRLEALRGSRTGQYSIRINDQWRLCFVWRDGGAEARRNRLLPPGVRTCATYRRSIR